MKPSEYLDACKARLSVESDYELAKRLDMKTGHLCMVRKGERPVPLDMAYKIAITLELDPATVVADLEGQRAKSEKTRAFWVSFTSRARLAAVLLACTLVWSFSGGAGVELGKPGGFRRRFRFV
jgi:hypothetical protein